MSDFVAANNRGWSEEEFLRRLRANIEKFKLRRGFMSELDDAMKWADDVADHFKYYPEELVKEIRRLRTDQEVTNGALSRTNFELSKVTEQLAVERKRAEEAESNLTTANFDLETYKTRALNAEFLLGKLRKERESHVECQMVECKSDRKRRASFCSTCYDAIKTELEKAKIELNQIPTPLDPDYIAYKLSKVCEANRKDCSALASLHSEINKLKGQLGGRVCGHDEYAMTCARCSLLREVQLTQERDHYKKQAEDLMAAGIEAAKRVKELEGLEGKPKD